MAWWIILSSRPGALRCSSRVCVRVRGGGGFFFFQMGNSFLLGIPPVVVVVEVEEQVQVSYIYIYIYILYTHTHQ